MESMKGRSFLKLLDYTPEEILQLMSLVDRVLENAETLAREVD